MDDVYLVYMNANALYCVRFRACEASLFGDKYFLGLGRPNLPSALHPVLPSADGPGKFMALVLLRAIYIPNGSLLNKNPPTRLSERKQSSPLLLIVHQSASHPAVRRSYFLCRNGVK